MAALTAAALGVAQRLTESTGQGGFRELLVRGDDGYVATYAAGGSAVLTLLAEPRINVGRLHLEAGVPAPGSASWSTGPWNAKT